MPLTLCSVEGCDRSRESRVGYCLKHYKRWKRHGDPGIVSRVVGRTGCTVDGCDRSHEAQGLCALHYQRQVAHGDLRAGELPRQQPLAVRLVMYTDPDGPVPEHWPELGPCALWTGPTQTSGHGQIRDDEGRLRMAHRLIYERDVGPIPDGLHLDHLCRRKTCVRGSHLEPVTHGENSRRARDCKRCSRVPTCPGCHADLARFGFPEYAVNRAGQYQPPGVDLAVWFGLHVGELRQEPWVPLPLGPCLIWTGKTDLHGYGTLSRNHHLLRAHRYALELVGIDPGECVDHLCRTRHCVRVEHLEVVTRAENSRRRHECPRCSILRAGCPFCGVRVLHVGSGVGS